jgi:hypothetical protein
MRRSLSVLGVCALVASSAVAVALAGSGASIRILSAQPLVISGTHFNAHERLTVTATVGTAETAKQVTATRQGTFKVTLGQNFRAADPCGTNGRIRVIRKGRPTLTRTLHLSQPSRGVACFMEGP